MKAAQDIGGRFDAVLSALLDGTAGSRTTLRIDLPEFGFHVNDVAGEARRPEEKSLRGETGIDQRAVETVKWLDRERRPLIQGDLSNTDVPAPKALIDIYGARAQMLAPIIVKDALQGWISVHYSKGARDWSAADTAALDEAVKSVQAIIAPYAGRL
ncbi:GAF domain-containing protein [Ancylobacter mangrovi]|uniref:GAF domain-containing protein n=1 Tax=Ancylobacter mangrovi TaxID=2972472 RepID=UPI0021621D13|nr:GAF domain-containing protein [Ancylobacter mangrovi]MCS0503279.1 GAF domain-containing protein [Ancylobacter mangrovi]